MTIKLPNKIKNGYSLFAEGMLIKHYFFKQLYQEHYLVFDDKYIVTLFYTYPHHRRLYVVYIDETNLLPKTKLPCVLSPVTVLYKARGKKIDNLKHVLYLFKNTSNDYLSYPILFYQKLFLNIELNRKINKSLLNSLLKYFNLPEVK